MLFQKKVKIITGSYHRNEYESLELEINEFFKKNPDILYQDLKINNSDYFVIAVIIYKERNN